MNSRKKIDVKFSLLSPEHDLIFDMLQPLVEAGMSHGLAARQILSEIAILTQSPLRHTLNGLAADSQRTPSGLHAPANDDSESALFAAFDQAVGG